MEMFDEDSDSNMNDERANSINNDNSDDDNLKNSSENDVLFNEFKSIQIEKFLTENDRLSLKALAFSNGGFISNDLRVKVWTYLINVDDEDNDLYDEFFDIHSSNNYRQVILDVDRSLKRFPPSVQELQRIAYQDKLTEIIIRILDHNPEMHYYQGYHDICLTFLLVMDERKALSLLNKISKTHLCFYMERTMNTTSNLMEIIYLILKEEDIELYDHLIRSDVGTIFSLSWIITWFSHVLKDLDNILRLFDLFISTHYLMPIYFTVAILLWKKSNILQIDCDMASMHKYLTSIPNQISSSSHIDQLIKDTLKLSIQYPPENMLEKQRQMHTNALNDDSTNDNNQLSVMSISRQILGQKFIPMASIGLISTVIYRLMYDYFRS